MKKDRYELEELVPIVAELASKYTGCEHSSITYEKAQDLMEAVLYCIHEFEGYYEHSAGILQEAVEKKICAKQAYEAGQKMVMDKVKSLQELYNELVLEFHDYGLVCLWDTFVKGIPAFLLKYDAIYLPQETLLTLDYPVLRDISGWSGIDAVYEYVKCIDFEQRFLKIFDEEYIVKILKAYYDTYEELIENICGIVVQNIIGHIMLNKPLCAIDFCAEEYKAISNMLCGKTEKEIADDIGSILNGFVKKVYNDDTQLLDYLKCGILNMVARIHTGVENQSLDRIFLI